MSVSSHVCVCTMCVHCLKRSEKGIRSGTELQMVVRYYVGAGN